MRFVSRVMSILALAALLPVLAFPVAVAAQEKPDTETIVLDTYGFWRCHYTFSLPVVRRGQDLEKVHFPAKWLEQDTAFPSGDWMAPDFDDGSWHRSAGIIRYFGRRNFGSISPMVALSCRRGRFTVTDPGRVEGLRLSLTYHGGVVVYLNGKEVARCHLPKHEKLTPATLAEDYPREVHVKPDGSALVMDYRDKDEELVRRISLRDRHLADVSIPSRLLRKGVNVLGIEIHRAPYSPEDVIKDKNAIAWGTCGLLSIRLTASTADGIVPNIRRPEGLQVWNSDPLASDFDLDYGDPNEPLRPITLVGTRNGVFSGKVVVGSTQSIKGLHAVASSLREEAGRTWLPASAVQVRYPEPLGTETAALFRYTAAPSRFDALLTRPPAEVPVREKSPGRGPWWHRKLDTEPKAVFGAVQPIWISVQVPADAKPGDYEGSLTIAASGTRPVVVPVKLHVGAWKLPDPGEWRTFVEFIQSPDTLALEYDVPLWSERHFQLIEQSLKLLGTVGNRSAYIPLICESNLGNAQSMVRWIKKPDGTYAHDFSILERYLDLVEKHYGTEKIICLVVWDTFLEGGRYTGQPRYVPKEVQEDREEHGGVGPEVTVLDVATGGVENVALPRYSEAASRALWKPLLDGLRARLKRRGLESAMMLGLVTDTKPTEDIISLFKDLLPGVPWLVQAHGGVRSLHGVPCAYSAYVWGCYFANEPSSGRSYGWKKPRLELFFPRCHLDPFPVVTQRLMPELNVAGQQRGFGRLGGDFWPVLKDKRGRLSRVSGGRFPKSSWRALNIVSSFLAPGPDGPVATTRLEMLREGVQECEARIFIEKALTDKALRAKLGEPLATRCEHILDERTRDMLRGTSAFIFGLHFTYNANSRHCWWHTPGVLGAHWFISSGWQERSGKLFAAAAEVHTMLGSNQ